MNETSVVPAVEAPKKKKKPASRRVGTFTMGLCLILGGIFLCVFLIRPEPRMLQLLQFSPVVLISLGIELLISHFRFPKARLKYDFLSVIVCFFVLLFGACGAAAGIAADVALNVPVRMDNWRDEIRGTCAGLLADEKIEAMDVSINNGRYDWEQVLSIYAKDADEIYSDADLTISLHLSGEYDTEDFAKEAKAVIRALHEGAVHPGQLLITAAGEDVPFLLELDGLFAHKLSVAELEALVSP